MDSINVQIHFSCFNTSWKREPYTTIRIEQGALKKKLSSRRTTKRKLNNGYIYCETQAEHMQSCVIMEVNAWIKTAVQPQITHIGAKTKNKTHKQ